MELAMDLAGGAGGGAGISTELAPAGEVNTGFTWAGATVYAQRFTGTMPVTTTATLVSGVAKIVKMMGYVTGASGKICATASGASTSFFVVDGSDALTLRNSGTDYDGNDYDVVIWYTKI